MPETVKKTKCGEGGGSKKIEVGWYAGEGKEDKMRGGGSKKKLRGGGMPERVGKTKCKGGGVANKI